MTPIDAITQNAAPDTRSRLVVYSDPSAFETLREEWLALEARDSRCGVFQSHTWLSHLWAFESGPHKRIQLAAVRGPDGRLDALAPLVIERRLGPVGVQVLRFIGRGFSDYQDILLADDCDRNATLSLLADWLQESMGQLDIIEFLKIQESAHLWNHRNTLLPAGLSRCSSEARTYDQSRYFPIEGGFDGYLNGLSRPTRKNYRRCWNRLHKTHEIEFRTVTRSEGAEGVLDDLVRLHQKRQRRRGQRGMFRSPHRIEVFKGLFRAMLDEGTLRLYLLVVNGRTFNIDLVFYHKQTVTLYNGGMDDDPDVARYSPGFLSIMIIIKDVHSDARIKKFDMGQGDERYKAHFAKHLQSLQRVCCTRSSMRCRLDQMHHRLRAWAHKNATVQRLYFGVRGRGLGDDRKIG